MQTRKKKTKCFLRAVYFLWMRMTIVKQSNVLNVSSYFIWEALCELHMGSGGRKRQRILRGAEVEVDLGARDRKRKDGARLFINTRLEVKES